MTLKLCGAIVLILGALPTVPTAWAKQDKGERMMHYYRDGAPVVVRLKQVKQANFSDEAGLSYKATGNRHNVVMNTPLGNKTLAMEEYLVFAPITATADQADFVWLVEGEPMIAPPIATGAAPGTPGLAVPQPPAPVEVHVRAVAAPIRGTINPAQGLMSVTKWVQIDTTEGPVLVNKDEIVVIRQLRQ